MRPLTSDLCSVAVGLSTGELLEEFDIDHRPEGFVELFSRVERDERRDTDVVGRQHPRDQPGLEVFGIRLHRWPLLGQVGSVRVALAGGSRLVALRAPSRKQPTDGKLLALLRSLLTHNFV